MIRVVQSGPLPFAFGVQTRVIGAVLMREIHTRFGKDNIGYLWMFIEPMLFASAISLLHILYHGHMAYDMEVLPFYLSGYVPFLMFRSMINRASATIDSNRTLLYHRQVTIFDLLIARSLLEFFATLLCYFLMIAGCAAFDMGSMPDRPLYILVGWCLALWFSLALSMCVCVASEMSPVVEKLVHPAVYISMPFSAVFFIVESMPAGFRESMMWIPTVHLTQYIREGQFGQFDSQYVDLFYVVQWCIVLTFIGLIAVRWVRPRVYVE